MKKAIDTIANLYSLIALVGLVVLICTMLLEIFMRYFTSSSIIWLHEFLGIVIIWISFLGFGKIVSDREDIMITYLVNRLTVKNKKKIMFFNTFLQLLSSIIICYVSAVLTVKGWNRSTLLLEAPYTLYYLPLVMLMLLIILVMIYHIKLLINDEIDIFIAHGEDTE